MSRHLGLLSIVITWPALLLLITRWKGNVSLSFSLHATKNRHSYLYYLVLFLVTLPMFYIFAIDWYIPTLQLGLLAKIAITAGVLFQLTAALIPDTTGWKRFVHRFTAYGMANILTLFSLIVVLSGTISVFARALSTLMLVTMVGLYALVFLEGKHYERFLIYQASYVACFHVMILVTTYYR